MSAPSIDARAVWQGDSKEAAKLYRQFTGYFGGNFYQMARYYGWKRASLLKHLRRGQ